MTVLVSVPGFLASQMMAVQKSIAALDRIDEILDIEPERKGNQIKKLPAFSGKISFSYPRNPELFDNLSMEIKQGERM